MRVLTGESVLTAWERGLETSPERAALAALALAEPERAPDDLARLPLGERNARLLELLAATRGRRLAGFTQCERCGAKLEFAFDSVDLANDLRARIGAMAQAAAVARLRPANTLDLLAAAHAKDEAEARSILLARTLCFDAASADDESEKSGGRWLARQPANVVESIEEAFESVNAAAEIRAQFQCAACGDAAVVDVDPAYFLVDEISRAARRLLQDVHELACSYGWSEEAILAMSDARRSAYLELLRA